MAWNSQPGAYSSSSQGDYYGSAGYGYPNSRGGSRQADAYAYQGSYPASSSWNTQAQGYSRDYDSARGDGSHSSYYRQADDEDQGGVSEGSRPQYRRVVSQRLPCGELRLTHVAYAGLDGGGGPRPAQPHRGTLPCGAVEGCQRGRWSGPPQCERYPHQDYRAGE